MDLLSLIEQFSQQVASRSIEIYNEASVQYELAILLRKQLDSSYKIQLERNINYFDLENKDDEARATTLSLSRLALRIR